MKIFFFCFLFGAVLASCQPQSETSPPNSNKFSETTTKTESLSGGSTENKENAEEFWESVKHWNCYEPKGSEQGKIDFSKTDPNAPFFSIIEICESPEKNAHIAFWITPYWNPYIVRWKEYALNFEVSQTIYNAFDKTQWLVYNGHSDLEWIYWEERKKNSKKWVWWKRNGNIVSLQFYDFFFDRSEEKYLKKEKNIRYCRTPLYRGVPICTVDITLEYDFVKNVVRETKSCTYYIDRASRTKKPLESCVEY